MRYNTMDHWWIARAFRLETIIDKGSSTRSQNVLMNPAQASDFPFWTHNSFSAWQPTTTTKISLLMSTCTLFLSSSRTVGSTQYSDPLYTSWQKHWKTVSFLPGHNARFSKTYNTIPTPDLENLLAKTHLYAELGNRTRPTIMMWYVHWKNQDYSYQSLATILINTGRIVVRIHVYNGL